MASATFSGGSSITYADGSVMSYDTEGRHCVRAELMAPDYGRVEISAPGVSGQGTKKNGFRGQVIVLHIVYVQVSENACFNAFQEDVDSLGSGVPAALSLGGEAYNGCILELGKTNMRQPKSTGNPAGKFFAEATIAVKSLRLTA